MKEKKEGAGRGTQTPQNPPTNPHSHRSEPNRSDLTRYRKFLLSKLFLQEKQYSVLLNSNLFRETSRGFALRPFAVRCGADHKTHKAVEKEVLTKIKCFLCAPFYTILNIKKILKCFVYTSLCSHKRDCALK